MGIEKIVVNKNRGWRGLAEVVAYSNGYKTVEAQMIFSFSQDVWDDLQKGVMVVQTPKEYIVLEIPAEDTARLPKGQRSVLIKNFVGSIKGERHYDKTKWVDQALANDDYYTIINFTRNSNAHTKSDWNSIGIRVRPFI